MNKKKHKVDITLFLCEKSIQTMHMSTLGAKGFFSLLISDFFSNFRLGSFIKPKARRISSQVFQERTSGGQGSTYPATTQRRDPYGKKRTLPPPPTPPNEFCCVKPRANGRNIVCQQLPTMLRPFVRSLKFDRFQALRKTFQQHATTCNRVYKRTQHVTSNNVGSCWQTTLGPFARSITLISSNPRILQKSIVMQVQLIK